MTEEDEIDKKDKELLDELYRQIKSKQQAKKQESMPSVRSESIVKTATVNKPEQKPQKKKHPKKKNSSHIH